MFKDLIKMTSLKRWVGVGKFPTPTPVARDFAAELVGSESFQSLVDEVRVRDGKLRVLEMFAGDGRLSEAVLKAVLTKYRLHCDIVLIEADERSVRGAFQSRAMTWEIGNAFAFHAKRKFDLVISNPPYLSLNVKRAKELGISWEEARAAGKNLYGLGIKECMRNCRPGGLVATIAPFGWTRGVASEEFRSSLKQLSTEVWVHAHKSRRLFPGVSQDIAFQIFRIRTSELELLVGNQIYFAFNGHKFRSVLLEHKTPNKSGLAANVRIGPIVWNREQEQLSTRRSGLIPLINGGNITRQGRLNLTAAKYQSRQFVKKNAGYSENWITRAPCILIRRTLRGVPGGWEVDSYLRVSNFKCFVENHVLVIELPKDISREKAKSIQLHLHSQLRKYHSVSGSPNLTVKIVKHALMTFKS